jgi:hypothetical protein
MTVPKDFAPCGTVYHCFRLWKHHGLWVSIHTRFREHVRLVENQNRQASVL